MPFCSVDGFALFIHSHADPAMSPTAPSRVPLCVFRERVNSRDLAPLIIDHLMALRCSP